MDRTLSPPTGQLLDGRYRVESRLARGGMATVYLGTDTRLDRTVALKIAHPELSGDEEFVRRFIGEARSAAKLSSPNVVAVYDQGSDGDVHYLAMEYVPGLTLRALLDERGRLSPREALDITEGVLAGLAVAHDAGIVHRDVKPENVLLTMANTVKVADFGLARAAARAEHTKSGMIIGTAAYLAPEQVSRSVSDERTDVYAVGVMLFELLTGAQPHTGETPLVVAYKHVSDIVPPPSTVVPGLPPALDALVALATSRDPDLRPPDAGYFLTAITEVRRGMPITDQRSRGQHAAPGRVYVAGPPGGLPTAHPWATQAADQPAASGPLHGTSLPGTSLPGTSLPGGSLPSGPPPGSQAAVDLHSNWPQAPGTAPGASSWPTGDHSPADEPPHGVVLPGFPAPSAPGGHRQAAELLPASAVLPPAAHRSENHTLIVAPGGLDAIFRDAPDYRQDRPGRGYRRRRELALHRWLFSRRLGYLAAAVAVVLIIGLAVWWISDGQYATVPQVGGIAAATASQELENLGFHVRAGAGQHSTLPRGDVVRTIPATGSRAKTGSQVTIISSLGPVLEQVPAVTGIQQADAVNKLREAGLTPGAITEQTSTTIPAGIVISTTPVAGVRWPKNKPVAIAVSAGLPLPNFVGAMVSAAQAAAQAGGYSINPVQNAKGTAPQGTISRQSPAPGSAIAQSEVVTVYFSPGPPMVAVPNVQFMNVDQAVQVLTQAGFKVSINKTGAGNRVVSFGPNGQQPAGTTITLNVGFGF